MTRPASEAFALHLQVGRLLRGRLLLLAVFLRELPLTLLGSGGGDVAPAWVVVDDRATKQRCWRVSAGRGYGSGEQLLEAMQADLAHMTEAEFQQEWRKSVPLPTVAVRPYRRLVLAHSDRCIAMLRAAVPEFESEYVAANAEVDGELGPFEAMSHYAEWCLSALRENATDVAARAFAAVEKLAVSDDAQLQLARPLTTEFVEALSRHADAVAAMGPATRRFLSNSE